MGLNYRFVFILLFGFLYFSVSEIFIEEGLAHICGFS